ncbi:SMI1/KNR4 family protein [Nonlabens ulvanivorans]|uniref:SMI1/KNR4 family protein n=1 Tax=Nonlabens ulvanivorans TaxID=906888 RepID=UPI0037C91B61
MPFPIEEKYMMELESELGLIFPLNFRNRMIKCNGGELITDDLEIELFPFFDKSDKKRISRTCNHIGIETKNAQGWNGFPDNGVAIGSDGFGNLLILAHKGDGNLADTIYFWTHDNGEIEKLANSIDELED